MNSYKVEVIRRVTVTERREFMVEAASPALAKMAAMDMALHPFDEEGPPVGKPQRRISKVTIL